MNLPDSVQRQPLFYCLTSSNSDLSNSLPSPHKPCRDEAVSSPAGFDEKTAVFDGKKFGLSVPAPGDDMASPLQGAYHEQADKLKLVFRLSWAIAHHFNPWRSHTSIIHQRSDFNIHYSFAPPER